YREGGASVKPTLLGKLNTVNDSRAVLHCLLVTRRLAEGQRVVRIRLVQVELRRVLIQRTRQVPDQPIGVVGGVGVQFCDSGVLPVSERERGGEVPAVYLVFLQPAKGHS